MSDEEGYIVEQRPASQAASGELSIELTTSYDYSSTVRLKAWVKGVGARERLYSKELFEDLTPNLCHSKSNSSSSSYPTASYKPALH